MISRRVIWAASLIVVPITALTACGASDSKAADTLAIVPAAAAAPARSKTHFAAADFARLRWLAGDWRGKMGDGRSFYERYRLIDDSTMRWGAFSDSTFRTQRDSALIGIRAGLVIDRGSGSPWFATRIDTNTVNFESDVTPANHFIWTRVSPDHWTANIFTTDQTGAEVKVLYQIERVKK